MYLFGNNEKKYNIITFCNILLLFKLLHNNYYQEDLFMTLAQMNYFIKLAECLSFT